mmetsp:Transcript_8597/g.26112  ORF Transcript_8597/g.26112 Transcript_8597/m.26112 type:complete len:315 (+) Transcript_8597:172-1116(+)
MKAKECCRTDCSTACSAGSNGSVSALSPTCNSAARRSTARRCPSSMKAMMKGPPSRATSSGPIASREPTICSLSASTQRRFAAELAPLDACFALRPASCSAPREPANTDVICGVKLERSRRSSTSSCASNMSRYVCSLTRPLAIVRRASARAAGPKTPSCGVRQASRASAAARRPFAANPSGGAPAAARTSAARASVPGGSLWAPAARPSQAQVHLGSSGGNRAISSRSSKGDPPEALGFPFSAAASAPGGAPAVLATRPKGLGGIAASPASSAAAAVFAAPLRKDAGGRPAVFCCNRILRPCRRRSSHSSSSS